MTNCTDSHDSRLESTIDRLVTGLDACVGRLLVVGCLTLTVASLATSYLASGALPDQFRIHWTLGMGPYYGPEFAPAVLILTLFPAIVGTVAAGAWVLDALFARAEALAPVRLVAVLATLFTLAVLLVSQVALVVANL